MAIYFHYIHSIYESINKDGSRSIITAPGSSVACLFIGISVSKTVHAAGILMIYHGAPFVGRTGMASQPVLKDVCYHVLRL